jgi:hypothetical protein
MALVSKPDHTRHTMTRTPVSKADMSWPTVASHLASNANRHSIKAAFEESTHQRLEIGKGLAPNDYMKCGKLRCSQSEEEDVKEDLG